MYLDTVVLMYQLILYYSFDLLFIRILPTNLFIHCRLLQTFKTLGLLDYISKKRSIYSETPFCFEICFVDLIYSMRKKAYVN